MNRGDVVRVQLPPPAGPSGREQFGTRPAIVLQVKAFTANLSTVVIVPLTSRLSASRFAGSFTVSPTEANGLSLESVVLTHQVRAIDQGRIEKVIGRLADNQMARLEAELRALLGL
jgi:mRNA-degrading endonuclease toxin of MazEF toxin-antitoxin module